MLLYLILLIYSQINEFESRVCSSIDVRNSPDYIAQYKDCRIVKGHVYIVLMERIDDPSEFQNRNFRDLYEITDYLLIYRVRGLVSLDVIFPNLRIIGGKKLFSSNQYAVILSDLPDLVEINLPSLRRIHKGGVSIDHCPNLCYVNTVNWTQIGVKSVIFYEEPDICVDKNCTMQCGGNCWNNFKCQINYPEDKCHNNCIGCTKPGSNAHCQLCKFHNDNGSCVENCPTSKIIDYTSADCLNPQECVNKNSSIMDQTCYPVCPQFHERSPEGFCLPSSKRTCPGFLITNIQHLSQLNGCTHINGSLELFLEKHIDDMYLERYLGDIQMISGYLKVAHCYSITDLFFFSQLTEIGGSKLWSNFSLLVIENQNLQDLFKQNVTVTNGQVLLQSNPHLCKDTFEGVTTIGENNGFQNNCNTSMLKVIVTKRNPTNFTLFWKAKLKPIGYVIYYTKSFDKGLRIKDSPFDENQLVLEDTWSSIFVTENQVELKKLTPFTRYTYYIKTMFRKGVLSSPLYEFNTPPGDPSEPLELVAQAEFDGILLTWKPPIFINGDLTYYSLALYRHSENVAFLQQRNYCSNPLEVDSCSCHHDLEEFQFFTKDSVCLTASCRYRNLYNLRRKRSIPVIDDIKDIKIPNTNPTNMSFRLKNLEPFTLYTIYLKACNRNESDEGDHCGGSFMETQRTLKKSGSDVVTNVSVTVEELDASVSWSEPLNPNSLVLAYRIEYKTVKGSPIFVCVLSNVSRAFKLSGLRASKYQLRIWTVSLASPDDEFSEWVYFSIVKKSSLSVLFYVVMSGVVLVLVFGLVLLLRWRWRQVQRKEFNDLVRGLSRPRDVDEIENEWKLDPETVEIVRELGENFVGMMFRKQ